MFLSARHRAMAALALFSIPVWVAPPPAAAEKAVDPLAWAPEDALFFMGTSDCTALAEAVKKTANYRAFTDPKLKSFYGPLAEAVEGWLTDLVEELGLDSVEELKVYPQGPAALIVTLAPPAEGQDEPDAHVVLAMDMGENTGQARELIARLTDTALDRGARKETEEVRGARIVTLRFPEPEEPAEEGPDSPEGSPAPGRDVEWELEDLELSYCLSRKMVLIGTSAEELARTLRCMRGRVKETLDRSAAGKLLARKCPEKAPLRLVFNLPKLIETAEQADAEAGKEMRAWGVDGLGPVVMALEPAPEPGIDVRLEGFWQVSPDKGGVPAMLRMKNRPTIPPATVSADAVMYGMLSLDPRVLVKEVLESTSRSDPEQGQAARAGMKMPMPDGTTIDLQADLIDHLAGPLSVQLTLARPYDADHVGIRISLGHTSRQAMEKALGLPMIGPMFRKRDLMGTPVYEPVGSPFQGVSLTTTDTALATGSTSEIERLVRATGKAGPSLADDPAFQRLARMMPKQASGMLFVDSARLLDAQLAILESGGATAPPAFPFGASVSELIRYGLVAFYSGKTAADLEAARPYQGSLLVTLSTEAEGLAIRSAAVVGEGSR